MTGEKTEKATPKQRKKNRKEGQVARTQELGAWSALAAVRDGRCRSCSATSSVALQRADDHQPQHRGHGEPRAGGHAARRRPLARAGDPGAARVRRGRWSGSPAPSPRAASTSPRRRSSPSSRSSTRSQVLKRMFSIKTLWDGAKMLIRCAIVAALVWSSVRAMMPIVGGLVPMQVVVDAAAAQRPRPGPQRRHRGRPARRRRLRRAAPPDRQEDQDVEGRGQAGAQAVRGRPDAEGRDPVPPARRRPQPDDGRHPDRGRGAGQPDPRRRRPALRPRARRPAGRRPRRRRDRHRDPRAGRRGATCRWCATSRSPAPSTRRAPSDRRSRPSSSPRSPRCWPS